MEEHKSTCQFFLVDAANMYDILERKITIFLEKFLYMTWTICSVHHAKLMSLSWKPNNTVQRLNWSLSASTILTLLNFSIF